MCCHMKVFISLVDAKIDGLGFGSPSICDQKRCLNLTIEEIFALDIVCCAVKLFVMIYIIGTITINYGRNLFYAYFYLIFNFFIVPHYITFFLYINQQQHLPFIKDSRIKAIILFLTTRKTILLVILLLFSFFSSLVYHPQFTFFFKWSCHYSLTTLLK